MLVVSSRRVVRVFLVFVLILRGGVIGRRILAFCRFVLVLFPFFLGVLIHFLFFLCLTASILPTGFHNAEVFRCSTSRRESELR